MKNLGQELLDDQKGLNYLLNEFDYDKTMDFISIYPDEMMTKDHLQILLVIFEANKKKKKFYYARKPIYEDVEYLLKKLKVVKDQFTQEELNQTKDLIRVVLHKAITQT